MGVSRVIPGRSGPPPAWANLGCTPAELCDVLAALLRGRDEELECDLAAGRLPISALTMLVERHRLACYLAGRLANSPLRARLPSALWEAIQGRRLQQEQRTTAILEEFRWLLPRFHAARIEVMLLKGPELADRFHGGLYQRGYGDLDLLVRERDRRRVLKLLEEMGYALRSRVLLSRSLMASVNHGFDFERQGVRLDLHWCLSRQPGYRIDEERIWARRVPWTQAGLTAHVPEPHDELHLLLISAFADLQRGALRLQSLLDVQALLAALDPFDVAEFLRERRWERTAEVCRSMLAINGLLLAGSASGQAWDEPREGFPSREQILALLESAPWHLPLKLWCARCLPVSLLHYGLWWLISLPLRTAASHPLLRPAPAPAAVGRTG